MESSNELEMNKWVHLKLTEQIDKEFELLSQRMTWLISGNAFLFTAYFIGLNIKTSNTFIYTLVLGTQQLPIVVLHPAEKLIALASIIVMGWYLCFASFVAMAAARQVVKEMKKIRSNFEVDILKELEFDFPITVPYRQGGGHDLGNIMHKHLPNVIALVWFVLLLIAVSSVFGSFVGSVIAVIVFLFGLIIYFTCVSRFISDVAKSIKVDYLQSVRDIKRSVNQT